MEISKFLISEIGTKLFKKEFKKFKNKFWKENEGRKKSIIRTLRAEILEYRESIRESREDMKMVADWDLNISTILDFCDEFRSNGQDSDSGKQLKKIKWNANINELAWLFSELKNKQARRKNKEGNLVTYIECTIDELTDFILNNFEAEKLSRGTIDQYLRDKKQRKKISF